MEETKKGKWKGGVWFPAGTESKNPKGNNQYTGKPKVNNLGPVEAFMLLPMAKQKQQISEWGKELFEKEKEIRPLKARFTMCKKIYEIKHYNWEDEFKK